MVKEGKIRLGDESIDYISFGRGKRNLIMIQGLNTGGFKGSGVMLSLMYRIFSKEYTVYLFDRPRGACSDITIEDLAESIIDAMSALKIDKADILGVSQGGMIAQYIALKRPDLVGKMVLAFTLSRNNETVSSAINSWISMVEKDDYRQLVSDMAERMYSEKYLRKYRPLIPMLAVLQKPKDKERFINLAKSCLSCNTYPQLNKIHCPTLVIGAEHDKIVGVEASGEIADTIGCELFIYEGLGHAAYEEAAKDFNKRVYDFFVAEE